MGLVLGCAVGPLVLEFGIFLCRRFSARGHLDALKNLLVIGLVTPAVSRHERKGHTSYSRDVIYISRCGRIHDYINLIDYVPLMYIYHDYTILLLYYAYNIHYVYNPF